MRLVRVLWTSGVLLQNMSIGCGVEALLSKKSRERCLMLDG